MESSYEVHDYVRAYLGDTPEAKDFAKQFLERRAKQNANQQKPVQQNQQQTLKQQQQQQQVSGAEPKPSVRRSRIKSSVSVLFNSLMSPVLETDGKTFWPRNNPASEGAGFCPSE